MGKDPDAGKDWGKRRRGWQRMRQLDSITDSMDMNLSKPWEIVKEREAWSATIHGVTKSQTWLSNWTVTITTMNTNQLGPWLISSKYLILFLTIGFWTCTHLLNKHLLKNYYVSSALEDSGEMMMSKTQLLPLRTLQSNSRVRGEQTKGQRYVISVRTGHEQAVVEAYNMIKKAFSAKRTAKPESEGFIRFSPGVS